MFLLGWGEKEKRLDPAYYIPSIVELEGMVRARCGNVRLNHYVKQMAGGATPKIEDSTKYATSEDGVPFVRVQNLTSEGVFDLEDVKYISYDTHKYDLKRSAFCDQDLVIKITGVGRMAIASTPPVGFCGNINQHSVKIVTGSREVSETLAAYLNLDFVEKLASRRATGGTRPALDYPALRSIPIIFDERIAKMMSDARELKEKAELKAQQLLDSIDDYLLGELGIIMPDKPADTLENRKFYRGFFEVSGNRLDPRYYTKYFISFYNALYNGRFRPETVKKISISICSGSTPRAGSDDYTDNSGIPFVRVKDLKDDTIDFSNVLFVKSDIHERSLKRSQLAEGDVLITIAGTIGLSIVVPSIIHANINQAIAKISVNKDLVNNQFLSIIINSVIGKVQTDRLSRPAVQKNLNFQEIGQILIPLPSNLSEQDIITKKVNDIKAKANQIKDNAMLEYQKSINVIENLILTDNN